jgi:hypothetical protein
MVDERGEKCKWWMKGGRNANGGRRVEKEMLDNYRFILPVRASHFRSVSKTISILKDLGHRCDWRTCYSRRGILDTSRKFCRRILDCAGLPILIDSSQRSFSRFCSIFLEQSEDGPHTLLNRGPRRIPITLALNFYRDLLNLCFQHRVEAQLVLRSDCEAVHLGIDVL